MAILFIVALLFLGANARPNGGWQQGPPMGRPMPGPSGGRWPPGGGRFPSGPVGGGNFPPGPMGPMPGQMEPWRQWDVQGAADSDEAESFDGKDPFLSWRVGGPLENGKGFGPAGFPPLRFPRHGRPHGGRRPPPRPGQPHFPPHLPPPRPGGGRPNITFVPLFQANNVTVQNLNVSTVLKAGENVFMLPPYYFKIFYNPNATQTVSFEFGVARISQQYPSSLRAGSESDEYP